RTVTDRQVYFGVGTRPRRGDAVAPEGAEPLPQGHDRVRGDVVRLEARDSRVEQRRSDGAADAAGADHPRPAPLRCHALFAQPVEQADALERVTVAAAVALPPDDVDAVGTGGAFGRSVHQPQRGGLVRDGHAQAVDVRRAAQAVECSRQVDGRDVQGYQHRVDSPALEGGVHQRRRTSLRDGITDDGEDTGASGDRGGHAVSSSHGAAVHLLATTGTWKGASVHAVGGTFFLSFVGDMAYSSPQAARCLLASADGFQTRGY